MHCHEPDYEISGDDMQVVEVELGPGETEVAEAGTMNWMADGIGFEARMGDGSKQESGFFGKFLDAGKRALTGESIFMMYFTNEDSGKKQAASSAPYPGKIIALDMGQVYGEFPCQKDAFLRAALGTEISVALTNRLGTGFFGGEGLFLATLRETETIYLQSVPFSRLADRILAHAPQAESKQQGEGSVLRRPGDMVDGD